MVIMDYRLLLVIINSVAVMGNAKDSRVDAKTVFQKLFLQKRIHQLEAVKNIMQLNEEKQKTILSTILEKIFQVLTKNKVALESSEFVPGSGVPEKEDVKNSVALVIENVCLVSDLLLRLPDALHQRLNKNKEWTIVYKWSITFVRETHLLDPNTEKMLDLASQEIGLVPKDKNYVNPYKQDKKKQKRFEELPQPKKKEKKKIKKGPRMSHAEL